MMQVEAGAEGQERFRIVSDVFVSGLAKARFVRIQPPDEKSPLSADDVAALIAAAEFDFASVRLPEEAEDKIAAFTAGGFYVTETLVTYRHDLNQVPSAMPAGTEWLESAEREGGDARDVGEIGRLSFKFDRFHADARIDDSLADLIKQEWSLNNLAGRALGSVVVRSNGGRIVGFCEIVGETERSAIDLIAVHPDYQRRGLARKLMEGTLYQLAQRGVAQLFVGTASINKASRALYEATGCVEAKREVTLHWAAREITL